MTKKTDGRKAIVIDYGKGFTTYKSFARKHGYPEAAADNDRDDKRVPLKNGDKVTLLTSGSHEGSYYKFPLWIVETANGERHIIAENGLRIIENETEGGESMENVVEIDGVKYREVKRKAAVGERIKTICIGGAFSSIPPDSVLVVERVYQDGSGVRTPNWGYSHEEYVVLEPITDGASPDVSDAERELVDLIVLQRELNGLKRQQAELTKQVDGLTDAFAKLAAKAVVPESVTEITPQQRRDEIVAQAKRDVAELQAEGRGGKHYSTGYIVDFVINRDKRTVVALLREPLYSTVITRGIAKAAPGDVFNSHIGRAIALRRALGLEVPTEYTNAPQPTEPRVGDVVNAFSGAHSGVSGIVESVRDRKYIDGENGLAFRNHSYEKKFGYSRCWTMLENVKIIDDSRESDVSE